VVEWPLLAAKHPHSFSFTLRPQQDGGRKQEEQEQENSWLKIKVNISQKLLLQAKQTRFGDFNLKHLVANGYWEAETTNI